MEARRRVVPILAALLLLALAAVTWRPLAVGWRCWQLWSRGTHTTAEVVHKLDPPALALRVGTGADPGETCIAKTSVSHHEILAVGERLPVVLRADRPGECELEATLTNSLWVLGALTGGIASAALLVVSLAVLLQRRLTQGPPAPARRLDLPSPPCCPRCGKEMAEGALLPMAGVHWRAPDEPTGLPLAFTGLPGTVGRWGPSRLQAWRCEACRVVTAAYG